MYFSLCTTWSWREDRHAARQTDRSCWACCTHYENLILTDVMLKSLWTGEVQRMGSKLDSPITNRFSPAAESRTFAKNIRNLVEAITCVNGCFSTHEKKGKKFVFLIFDIISNLWIYKETPPLQYSSYCFKTRPIPLPHELHQAFNMQRWVKLHQDW